MGSLRGKPFGDHSFGPTHEFELDRENMEQKEEKINHPLHYGGGDNPYEAIKVIEAWGLNFSLGSAVKYISRHQKKENAVEDLRKAAWYCNREADRLQKAEKRT